MTWELATADCIDWMNAMSENSVDLVFGSPPYMDARTYGINAVRDCQEWVDWMLDVTSAAVRISRGLVLWVVSGVQREKCYWPGCEGLAWEWWKRGNQLWRPCIWWKVDNDEGGTGIPGSGGKQWLRNDWEYVLAFKKDGWLPWADPLVFGHEPVYGHVGGMMSNRTADGRRINEAAQAVASKPWSDDPWKTKSRGGAGIGGRRKDGTKNVGPKICSNRWPNGKRKINKEMEIMDVTAGKDADGNLLPNRKACMPKIANPGNVLDNLADDACQDLVGGVVKARVGGGHMGSELCHDNEAPFPEALAEFFTCSFCPPGGKVADCFLGSGTTGVVSVRHCRDFLGCDVRQSQVDLATRRINQETPQSLFY